MTSQWASILLCAGAILSAPVLAQPSLPWQEYSRLIDNKKTIEALSTQLFGEEVDLYNGKTSFSITDVDLPGNSHLPVRFTRIFEFRGRVRNQPAPLADWEIDLPRVGGVYPHALRDWNQITYHSWNNQRCSGARYPEPVLPFTYKDFWYGIHARTIPGGGELLEPNPRTQAPASGGPYRWVTKGLTWFACLPSILNGPGEGFFAIAPDGTKYWFNWLAQRPDTELIKPVYLSTLELHLERRENQLYATRVEDRFGNWVNYSYSNASSEPARLTKIESNDGRVISISYQDGRIRTVSAENRTWTYAYEQVLAHPYILTSVTLPDGSKWKYETTQINHIGNPASDESSCDHPGITGLQWPMPNRVAYMTHPSGAQAEFEFNHRLHGRSDVPRMCQQYMPDTAHHSYYVRNYWGVSLVRKRLYGPGLDNVVWTYSYVDSHAATAHPPTYEPPGSWANGGTYSGPDPVCVSEQCAKYTRTEVHGPDGWKRYTFGNSYRYNEHKLVKIESGAGPSAILRTEQLSYNLERSGQAFHPQVGVSLQDIGDTFTETYLRPIRSTSIMQDGAHFRTTTHEYDSKARPVRVTKERL